MTSTLYLDGEWRKSIDAATRQIRSPAYGTLVNTVSEAGVADALAAIASARAAFDNGEFRSWSWLERSDLLFKIADLIERDHDILAELESADTGKRLIEAQYDMADVAATFRYFAERALAYQEKSERTVDVGQDHIDSRVVYEAIGVCALIGPWNYPLLQISWKVAPALAAGCSFIIKPSELTPSTAIHLMKILAEAGTPRGVANLLTGAGSTIGDTLTSDPRVDMVSFTGGLSTGKRITIKAAETVKRVALELGGKNPHIIFADADIDAATDFAVTAAFLHSGQVCSAGTRLILERSIHDRVVSEIVRRAKSIRLGGPSDLSAETGPLISEGHLQKVEEYLARALAEGAQLLTGGGRSTEPELAQGWYFPPTVLDHCDTNMHCVQEESFGPILTVEVFDTEAEAISLGNDTIYGLSGAVWSSDLAKTERVSRALRHGTIWINDYGPYKPQAEWGGFKASGNGRELGEHGLQEYLEIKHIWANNSPSKSGWFSDGTSEIRRDDFG